MLNSFVQLNHNSEEWDGMRLEFDPNFPHGAFSRSGHTSVLQAGTLVATLPDARQYRVSIGTGWSVVIIL